MVQTLDIGACVASLLFENNSVSLPGLGSITTQYQSATIDHVQGKISSPAKALTFDTNLVLDDGLLAETAARRYEVPLHIAAEAVTDYVRGIQNTLDRREMFELSGVGRLYRDFEQKIQFISDEHNFNPESYGLPTVQYYPVVRRTTQDAASPTPVPSPAARRTGWWQRNMVWWIAAAMLILAAGIYWIQVGSKPSDPAEETAQIPEELHNVPPGGVTTEPTEEPASPPPPPAEEEEIVDESEAPTLPPDQQVCTIRLGRFGNADNVKRLVKKAQTLGLNPYTKKVGGLTEVGLTFEYSEESEIKETLRLARRSLAKDAVVESQ
jgi:hypothetical protein